MVDSRGPFQIELQFADERRRNKNQSLSQPSLTSFVSHLSILHCRPALLWDYVLNHVNISHQHTLIVCVHIVLFFGEGKN